MPRRRRVIKGGYVWECSFIHDVLVRDPEAKTRFSEMYKAYVAYSEERAWKPVIAAVFASVLRREAGYMREVYSQGRQKIRWHGLGLPPSLCGSRVAEGNR